MYFVGYSCPRTEIDRKRINPFNKHKNWKSANFWHFRQYSHLVTRIQEIKCLGRKKTLQVQRKHYFLEINIHKGLFKRIICWLFFNNVIIVMELPFKFFFNNLINVTSLLKINNKMCYFSWTIKLFCLPWEFSLTFNFWYFILQLVIYMFLNYETMNFKLWNYELKWNFWITVKLEQALLLSYNVDFFRFFFLVLSSLPYQ